MRFSVRGMIPGFSVVGTLAYAQKMVRADWNRKMAKPHAPGGEGAARACWTPPSNPLEPPVRVSCAIVFVSDMPCVQEPKVVFGVPIAQYADPDGPVVSVSQ